LRHASLGIDPVLPRALDGLKARVVLHGRAVALRYRVGPRGHGPIAITCNGRALALDREPHPYRIGGVVMPLHELRDGENDIEIEVG
jgi:CRISPR-associated protein Csx3